MKNALNDSDKSKNLLDSVGVVAELFSKVVELASQENRIYTIDDAAKFLKVKRTTIENHLYRKRNLRYCVIGGKARITKEDLHDFVERQLVPCVNDKDILP